MQVFVRRNYKLPRFDAYVEWEAAGYLTYEIQDGYLDIQHTVVKPELRGNGIGEALLDFAVKYAEKNNLKIKPTCSYAAKKLSPNGEMGTGACCQWQPPKQ